MAPLFCVTTRATESMPPEWATVSQRSRISLASLVLTPSLVLQVVCDRKPYGFVSLTAKIYGNFWPQEGSYGRKYVFREVAYRKIGFTVLMVSVFRQKNFFRSHTLLGQSPKLQSAVSKNPLVS